MRFMVAPRLPDSNASDEQIQLLARGADLDPHTPQNRNLIRSAAELRDLRSRLQALEVRVDSADINTWRYLMSETIKSETRLGDIKMEAWILQAQRQQLCEENQPFRTVVDNDSFRRCSSGASITQLVGWFTALVMYLLYATSERTSNMTLHSLEASLAAGLSIIAIRHSLDLDQALVFGKAYSLKKALKEFDLDPSSYEFASCPRCSKLHQIIGEEFSASCKFQDENGEVCGEPLGLQQRTKGGRLIVRPRKLFRYQSVLDWFGSLVLRPGMEDLLDKQPTPTVNGGLASDIWESQFAANFRWSDGRPFWESSSPPRYHEGRYLFGLAVDWFNAHHSVAGKKTHSVGAIFLVCLNLPPHLRHRRENVCLLGVIPGPQKPPGDQINHFLRPLVDELLLLWTSGVWLTGTHKYPTGRLVRAALGPLICDLEAARPIGGFTVATAKRFCSFCLLHLHQIALSLQLSALPLRNLSQHLEDAVSWMGVASEKDRRDLEDINGVRWTVLLDLPYWDPIRCTVLDIMHNIFLGNLRQHIREIWNQDMKAAQGNDGATIIHKLPPNAATWFRAIAVLTQGGGRKSLRVFDTGTLETLCWDRGLMGSLGPDPTKDTMIQALLQSRNQESGRIHTVEEEEDAEILATPQKNWASLGKRLLKNACNRRLAPGEARFRERDATVSKPILAQFLASRAPELNPNLPDEKSAEEAELESRRRKMKDDPPLVLASDVMHHVHNDMEKTTMPSWIKPAPRKMGYVSHGKLSADQWRVACLVHYPITLIRLWGHGRPTSIHNPRFLDMLDNFIHLVLAASLASRRSTSEYRQKQFLHHMESYLLGLRKLYPAATITPNHHLSLHIPHLLRRFGPPHSWWAFPFERYNGILQGFSTNSRLGEMEATMFKKFCQGSSLTARIVDLDLPKPLHVVAKKVRDSLSTIYQGTLLDESIALSTSLSVFAKRDSSPTELAVEEREALRSAGMLAPRICSKLVRSGLEIYETYTTSARNSAVSFRLQLSGSPVQHLVGRIVRIIDDGTGKPDTVKLIVQEFQPLNIPKNMRFFDPYLRYPELGARLVSSKLSPKLLVIDAKALDGHLATCPFNSGSYADAGLPKDSIITLTLDRS